MSFKRKPSDTNDKNNESKLKKKAVGFSMGEAF